MPSKPMPLVSVIIPCHNHQDYIAECLRSVLIQKGANIQITVVDDASTDNSVEIIKSFLEDSRITLLPNNKNLGLVNTINKALEQNDLGDYVCILASDDAWPQGKLATQVAFMEANPQVVLSFGNYLEIDDTGLPIKEVRCASPEGNWLDELLLSNFIAAPTTMIRSEVFKKIPKFDPKDQIEDWAMWLKIAREFGGLGHIDAVMAHYRLHSTNTHKNYKDMFENSMELLSQFKDSKNYEKALSLAKAKYVTKATIDSPLIGIKLLASQIRPPDIARVASCYIKGKGPFRKFRFSYLVNKLKLALAS